MAKKKAKEADNAVQAKEEQKKALITAHLMDSRVVTESSDPARELFNKSVYGKLTDEGKVQISLIEAYYLIEKGKLILLKKDKEVKKEELLKYAKKLEPNFWVKYCVFRDIRDRGYVIKTALKFGADFRVYDRGVKPGEDHAKWIVYPVHESLTLTWYDFAAKNRVAHSTKKRLLIGIVDHEDDVTYYEIKWTRP